MGRSEKTVVIVEDDKDWCETITEVLGQKGYVTFVLHDLDALAQALSNGQVTRDMVAIVDGNLVKGEGGNFDGQEATQQLHAHNVLVIGQPSDGEIEGVDFSLTKLSSSKELLSVLAQAFAQIPSELERNQKI